MEIGQRKMAPINLRLSSEQDVKISRIAEKSKMKKADVIRNLIDVGLENTDHEKMVDKFERLQKEMEKFSESVMSRFENISIALRSIDQRLSV